MNLIRICGRALAQLGPERSFAARLAIGNVALAAAHFAEPILFGRIAEPARGRASRKGCARLAQCPAAARALAAPRAPSPLKA